MSTPKFTWSYSSLKDYINCPRKYHETKVLKRYFSPPTKEMTYGNEVHKACEEYVGNDVPLAENYKFVQPALDSLKEIPGERSPEQRMALNMAGEACKWSDPDCWVRGIVDLAIIDGETAFVIDYKTGSNKYPDPDQLKLMALMIFAHYPEVNIIKAGLLFVVKNSFLPEDYKRKDINKLWAVFKPNLARLEMSYDTGMWSPNPTPLCPWCPVKSCEHYGEK